MSKQQTSQFTPPMEDSYFAPHIQPKVRSHIVPKVVSRIQPKLMMNLKPKHNPLEEEADEMGKLASEGKEVNVMLAADGTIQKKDEDSKITDKGETKHAKGTFDSTTNSYTVPDTSVYEDPQQAFDTLYSISVRFGVSIEAIKKANSLLSDAVVPGQTLVIPARNVVKEEPKPLKQEVKQNTNSKPKPVVPQKQESVASLIEKHTDYMMLNEEALANDLVKNYLFSNPAIVLEVLKQVEEWNEDDVVVELMKLISENNWKNIDKKLLSEFKRILHSGFESDEEKILIDRIDGVLNPAIEKPITDKINMISPVKAIASDTSAVKTSIPTTSNPGPEKEPYASQMDNKYYMEKMYGDKSQGKVVKNSNECNVTSLAMTLRKLENEQILKNRTFDLLISGQGYSEDQRNTFIKKDLEDLILLRFEQVGVEHFLDMFPKGTNTLPYHPHQIAGCLNRIGKELLSKSSKEAIKSNILDKDSYESQIVPLLKNGWTAIVSSKLTPSGHIVSLEEVKDDGIVINDPYGILGSKQGDYIINGQSLSPKFKNIIKDSQTTLSNKLKYNSDILILLNSLQNKKDYSCALPHNLGVKNFYSWQQINTYKIGLWVSLLKN
jgi:LysM repeat protein